MVKKGGIKSRPCAKCTKPFIPTEERRLTCETCFHSNSDVPPITSLPNQNEFDSKTMLYFIRNTPVTVTEK
jgi:hypothetical protein